MLKSAPLIAKIGVDTAEDESPKVSRTERVPNSKGSCNQGPFGCRRIRELGTRQRPVYNVAIGRTASATCTLMYSQLRRKLADI